jgi:hypothetical protein
MSSHVAPGDRVYVIGSNGVNEFANVTRITILGGPGIEVLTATGLSLAFCGQEASDLAIVNKATGLNGKGTTVPLPADV